MNGQDCGDIYRGLMRAKEIQTRSAMGYRKGQGCCFRGRGVNHYMVISDEMAEPLPRSPAVRGVRS